MDLLFIIIIQSADQDQLWATGKKVDSLIWC